MPLTIDEMKARQIQLETQLKLIGDILFTIETQKREIEMDCESISQNLFEALKERSAAQH